LDWFDRTPVGRVLNRFSSDMNIIDRMLPNTWGMNINSAFMIVGLLTVIASVFPIFLVSVPVLFFIFRILQQHYLFSSRELKRIDSINRSPIYASFSEGLNGLATIRAFGFQELFNGIHKEKVDASSRAIFAAKVGLERWFAMRMENIGNAVVLFVAFLTVFQYVDFYPMEPVSAATTGLALVYGIQTTFILSWFVRMMAEMENQMNSVERCQAYVDDNDKEDTPDAKDVPDSWPSQGAIEVVDLSVRYRADLEPAVSGLSLSIQPGHKVGVVGRTGSGKSTLMLALFRMVSFEGSITIDGIDIKTIALPKLRRALSVIPQDPVIFTGTVRFNLDPFSESSDDRVWEVLKEVHLDNRVEQAGGLEATVDEAGSNFSTGEVQLLCIGRALLRGCKILVLDEATASVDDTTDRLIQRTFRAAFKGCTILTIAHRIKTIIDSDRILVLDAGRVVDYDPPKVLLARSTADSKFSQLVQASGQEDFLRAVVDGSVSLESELS